MSVVRRGVVLAVALLTASSALGACRSGTDGPAAEPTPALTPLADLATEDIAVVRGDFCAGIGPQAVEEALGDDASDATAWGNGERVHVTQDVRDVVHEFGCAWTGATSGDSARAWVFAPPVTSRQARRLGRAAARAAGCERVRDAERFGTHSLAVTCRTEGQETTTYHGLFGDAWLSCSLTGADRARTARWCAAVVQAGRAA